MLDTTGSDEMSSPFKLMLIFCLCCFYSPARARITVNKTFLYAAEPDGYVIVTVYNDALPQAGDVWTFSYSTTDDGAKAGLDYTATSMVNQVVVSPQRSFDIVVNITDDDVTEYYEPFLLVLTAFSQGDIKVTIYIVDERFGLHVRTGINIREGTQDRFIDLSVQYGIGVNVTINTVDMTATAGEDYEAITDRRVTLSAGRSVSLTVHIINDTLMEPSETFLVTVNGSSLSKNLTITLNIEDDDHPVNSDCNRLGEYCLNGGSLCMSDGVCWCAHPHTGPNCAINSDHIQGGPGCNSLDCVHGTCMSNGTLATCACDRNYTGDLCDKESYFHQCNPNNISICLSTPDNMHYVSHVHVTNNMTIRMCELTFAPNPPDPSDGIVDWCKGYAGVLDINTTCGEFDFITEGGLTTSVLRMNILFGIGLGLERVTFRCPNNYGMEVEDESCCQPDPGMEHAVNMSQANGISLECLLPLLKTEDDRQTLPRVSWTQPTRTCCTAGVNQDSVTTATTAG